MFIFNLFSTLVQIGMVAGAGIFVFCDYRQDFRMSRMAFEKTMGAAKQFFGIEEDELSRANRIVTAHAQALGALRETVATIEANITQMEQQAGEQRALASGFEEVQVLAYEEGDAQAERTAAQAKLNALKRAKFYEEKVGKQHEVAGVLHQDLDTAELEFDAVQSGAEMVRAQAKIAQANAQLYRLVSLIEAAAGLTPRGELKALLTSTEHAQLKSEELLRMARGHNGGVLQYKEDIDLSRDIAMTRERAALGSPQTKELPEAQHTEAV